MKNGFRAGRASGYIKIDRQNLVNALNHAVDIVHAAGIGAGAHGNNPAGFCHLFVQAQDYRCNFLEDRSGDNHQVSLAG